MKHNWKDNKINNVGVFECESCKLCITNGKHLKDNLTRTQTGNMLFVHFNNLSVKEIIAFAENKANSECSSIINSVWK